MNSAMQKQGYRVAIAGGLFLAGTIFGIDLFSVLATGLLAILLIGDWRIWSQRLSGRMAIAVLMATLLIIYLTRLPLTVFAGVSHYSGVIVLIVGVSVFRVPLRFIRLDHPALPRLGQRTSLRYITAVSSIIAPLLNMATLALFGSILSRQSGDAPRVSAAVTRGVGAALLVAPTFAPTAIVLSEYPDATWLGTLPVAVPLFVILLLGDFIWNRGPAVDLNAPEGATLPFYHIPLLIGMMAAAMVTFRWLAGLDILSSVTLAAGVSVGMWCICMRPFEGRCTDTLLSQIGSTWCSMRAEAMLFLAAGLLAHVLSTIPEALSGWAVFDISALLHQPMAALVIVILGMPLVTLLGIHPIIPFVALVHLIRPQVLGFTAAEMYVLWMVAWVLSMLISPVSALNITAAASFNVSPLTVGIRENAVYAAGFAMVALTMFGMLVN